MRSIGKANINKVMRITKKEMSRCKNPWGSYDYKPGEVEDAVIDQLPSSMWDTWEMADAEIRRIINDMIDEVVFGKDPLDRILDYQDSKGRRDGN